MIAHHDAMALKNLAELLFEEGKLSKSIVYGGPIVNEPP